jgi:hypothetical protein
LPVRRTMQPARTRPGAIPRLKLRSAKHAGSEPADCGRDCRTDASHLGQRGLAWKDGLR